MSNQAGYPLPSGELGSDDIVCQLVYLPDRPEYWQAFYGALSYMSTWRAWERDDDKRGKDAAANWREALELTTECWRMTCLEELQDNVAEILAIMQLGQSCCDEQDVTDGDQYTDRVEDGVGNVPPNIIDAGYASGTSDWAGFDDYKCMISHVTVNQMSARLDEFAELVNQYGAVAGGLAAVAAILAVIFGTGGLAIVFGMVAGVGAVSLLYENLMAFPSIENLSTKVGTFHDELACAIYFSDGDQDSLDNLNDKIDELFTVPEALILKNMNNGPTLKGLYAGRYDQQDIAEILEAAGYDLGDFDCTCYFPVGEFLLEYDFDVNMSPWASSGATYPQTGRTGNCPTVIHTNGWIKQTSTTLLGEAFGGASVGDTITLHNISFWYYVQTGWTGTRPWVRCENDAATFEIQLAYDNAWHYYEKTFDPPLVSTHFKDNVFRIKAGAGGGGNVWIDDARIDFDAVEI